MGVACGRQIGNRNTWSPRNPRRHDRPSRLTRIVPALPGYVELRGVPQNPFVFPRALPPLLL